jgi:hypothetical protein
MSTNNEVSPYDLSVYLPRQLGLTKKEIKKYHKKWCSFALACAPYKDLPNPLKKMEYAEKCLEFGVQILVLFKCTPAGFTLAMEVERRLRQIDHILFEGQEAQPNIDPQDPYKNTVPQCFKDGPPYLRCEFKDLNYVEKYLETFPHPDDFVTDFDMFA